MEEQNTTNKIPLLIVGSVVTIVIIIAGIVLFAQDRVSVTQRSDTLETELTQNVDVTGQIGLTHKGTQTTYREGQQVTLFIYADSQEEEITGYDAVLRYDSEKLALESVKSVLDGMDIYDTQEDIGNNTTELIVTGVRSLSRQDPFVFDNRALAEVTFTILDGGPIDVNVVYEPGSNRESNLITARNADILNNVVGTTIEVR